MAIPVVVLRTSMWLLGKELNTHATCKLLPASPMTCLEKSRMANGDKRWEDLRQGQFGHDRMWLQDIAMIINVGWSPSTQILIRLQGYCHDWMVGSPFVSRIVITLNSCWTNGRNRRTTYIYVSAIYTHSYSDSEITADKWHRCNQITFAELMYWVEVVSNVHLLAIVQFNQEIQMLKSLLSTVL